MIEPEQPTLDGLPLGVRPQREATAKEKDDAENKVRWSKYISAKRVHCYACIEARMKGHDVPPRRAVWSRRLGHVEVLLCSEHAQQARDGRT